MIGFAELIVIVMVLFLILGWQRLMGRGSDGD